MARIRKLVVVFLVGFALLVAGVAILLLVADEDRPSGVASPEAEARTERVFAAIHKDAWDATGAVRWRLREGRPLHLWDKAGRRALVTYDGADPVLVVALDLGGGPARARRGDAELGGHDLERAAERARADFVNDSFWLNAPSKLRDDGTTRSLTPEGDLLVAYASGGVTPGDAYLWKLDDEGRPRAWQMWVQIIPVGGLEVTWEEWTPLSTGALIARTHKGPLGLEVRLDPLEGAASLAALLGTDEDPFTAAFAPPGGAAAPPPAASSQPAAAPSAPEAAAAAADAGPG